MKLLLCFVLSLAMQFGSRKAATLPEYESFSHWSAQLYTSQYSRSFDKDGIIVQKNEYHPLTISVYGIISYDHFRNTGDSVYYYHVLNQYKYFTYPGNVVYSDSNQCAGLPYNFDSQGMKAPWYSGMTQGTAVSFLLRYYQLTNDKHALELSQQLIRLMLKPDTAGGTLGRTPEGGLWIEEYPQSTKSRCVLNGFINGFIGLYEYCLFFPNDKSASAIRDSCYEELIETIGKYDTPYWSAYSRNGFPLSNSYLRYQLEELDHLYTLYGDQRLRNQMKIWARMGYNKLDQELKFLKLPSYQFGDELSGNPITDSCVYNNYVDFAKGLVTAVPTTLEKSRSTYQFPTERYYAEIRILSDEIESPEITVTATWKEKVVAVNITLSGKRIVAESETPFDALEVKFPKQKSRKSCPVQVSTYDHRVSSLPLFRFFTVKKYETLQKGKTYSYSCAGLNLTRARVFYRCGQPGKKPEASKYTYQQSFDLQGGSFTAQEDGVYQFFISYDLMHPLSAISNLKLSENK